MNKTENHTFCTCSIPKPSKWLEGHCLVCAKALGTPTYSQQTRSRTPSPQFKLGEPHHLSMQSHLPSVHSSFACSPSTRLFSHSRSKPSHLAGYYETSSSINEEDYRTLSRSVSGRNPYLVHSKTQSRGFSPKRKAIYVSEIPQLPFETLPRHSLLATERVFQAHNNSVNALALQSRKLCSAGQDYVIHAWNTMSRRNLPEFSLRAHSRPVKCLAIDSGLVVSGATDNKIRFWDEDECVGVIKNVCVRSLTFASPITLITGNADGSVCLWDVETRKMARGFSDHTGSVNKVLSFNYSAFMTGSVDCNVKLWDIRASRSICTFDGHCGPLTDVMIWDENSFYSASEDLSIIKWDIRTGGILQKIHEEFCPRAIQWVRDKLVIGGLFLKVLGANTASYIELASRAVKCLLFDEDSDRLYAGAMDGSITSFRPNF